MLQMTKLYCIDTKQVILSSRLADTLTHRNEIIIRNLLHLGKRIHLPGKSRQKRRIQTLKNRENEMPYTIPLIDSFRIGPVIMILQRVGCHIFLNLFTTERQHRPQQADTHQIPPSHRNSRLGLHTGHAAQPCST